VDDSFSGLRQYCAGRALGAGAIPVPAAADASGDVSVTAKVNYRHLRQSYLNNIFGKGDHPAYRRRNCIADKGAEDRREYAGSNGPHDNQDWMRWNNLGIALLDQFNIRSRSGLQRGSEVAPRLFDGYTNIGLTEIVWEKYDSARTAIGKALSLSPDSARARLLRWPFGSGVP